MLKTIKTFALLILSALLLGCNGSGSSSKESSDKDSAQAEEPKKEEQAKEEKTPEISEDDIKSFLFSKEGTYGWQTKSDDISYDFFKDGRLAVQGPEGEATMWEGNWKLSGNQLTMECKGCGSLKEKETLIVKIEGENLVLGDKVYTRYAPK